MTACSFFSIIFLRTVLPRFKKKKKKKKKKDDIYYQVFSSLSLPADYFNLHWALYSQDLILIWDSVASLPFVMYRFSSNQCVSAL